MISHLEIVFLNEIVSKIELFQINGFQNFKTSKSFNLQDRLKYWYGLFDKLTSILLWFAKLTPTSNCGKNLEFGVGFEIDIG